MWPQPGHLATQENRFQSLPQDCGDGIRGSPLGVICLKHNKYSSLAFPNLLSTVLTSTLECQGLNVSGSLPPAIAPEDSMDADQSRLFSMKFHTELIPKSKIMVKTVKRNQA